MGARMGAEAVAAYVLQVLVFLAQMFLWLLAGILVLVALFWGFLGAVWAVGWLDRKLRSRAGR